MTSKIAAMLLLATATGLPSLARADYTFVLSPVPVVAPAAVGFSNSTSTFLSPGTVVPPLYNFLDTWTFTLGGDAQIGAFVGSLNFLDGSGAVTMGIANLQLNLVGPSGVVQGWANVISGTGFEQVFSVISPTGYFAAGAYQLKVRGLLQGPASSYAGTLQAVTAVPLPAAAPLMAIGLVGLGTALRRRRKRP